GNDEANVGHLDGLLATQDSLFLADLTTTGNMSNSPAKGAIYQIRVKPNQPPVLETIADQTTPEGQPVSFTAIATDPTAGHTLTFSLGAGAPEGATIDPATGLFSFPPTDGPAVYSITVRVTDDGSPSRSATLTFDLTVTNVAPTAAITGPTDGFGGVAGQ